MAERSFLIATRVLNVYIVIYYNHDMKKIKFPELMQTYLWDCGAKAMQSVLIYYGFDVPEQTVMKIAGTTPKGTPADGLERVAQQYKLKSECRSMTKDDLKTYIKKQIPVIILVQAWPKKEEKNWERHWADSHYVVVTGYDRKRLYCEDPWVAHRAYLTWDELEKRWHGIIRRKRYHHWGMAVFGKNAGYDPKKIVHID